MCSLKIEPIIIMLIGETVQRHHLDKLKLIKVIFYVITNTILTVAQRTKLKSVRKTQVRSYRLG